MIETERRHWSKQARIEGGTRTPEERDLDFRYQIEADLVIMAFGFDASPVEGEDASKLETNKWGNYEVDRIKRTSWPGVFAGGDIVRGADLVVTAIKDGREAAKGIDEHLPHLPRGESAGAEVLATERGQM